MKIVIHGQRIALLTGMIFLTTLGFNIATVQARGHGGGAHGGGSHIGGGGHHHGQHPHEHYRGGEHPEAGVGYDSHYHHDHDNYGDHRHDCRSIEGVADDGQDPFNEECRNHKDEWESSSGD